MSDPRAAALVACPKTLGSKPSWMSQAQYDADGGPCKCLLPAGHEPPCVCDHTKEADRSGVPAAGGPMRPTTDHVHEWTRRRMTNGAPWWSCSCGEATDQDPEQP